ncbi:sulfite reductase beta subunit [Uncinocarpus reesii 1704]|uniref:Sulfite reductase [NADPH] subunit beta n=1 Tax=Uncinocarpus reesii (strain UAMH 1704) TaxID=336963 RepID=C4JDA5_UNCRE|nr:sulfite reductase beta subunit [Uncinocarpus reesii 1704]EEP75501.1 sulfite reductase beta subunit [Uncinocarpus reesii 1704]
MSVKTAGEAAARIAYLSSDLVLSVQPSLQGESTFSRQLKQLSADNVRAVRQNEDPLLSAFHPLQNGTYVSVTTSSSILLSSTPHLYRLAQYPIVLHVSLEPAAFPDFSVISSIRQCGFSFLHSQTVQEAQDMALTSHALAIKSGKGVIHFFDASNSTDDQPIAEEDPAFVRDILDLNSARAIHQPGVSQTIYASSGRVATVEEQGLAAAQSQPLATPELSIPSKDVPSTEASSIVSSQRESVAGSTVPSSAATTVEAPTRRPVDASDIFQITTHIWDSLAARTGRSYHAIEYSGPQDAKQALFIFGSTGVLVNALRNSSSREDFKGVGVITARLYRPWLGIQISRAIPNSLERIAVLEQVRRTTKWGPCFLDLLSSLAPQALITNRPLLVSFRLGYVEPATADQALRGIFQNLTASSPIQNLEVGVQKGSAELDASLQLKPNANENAYTKILTQLFDGRLHVANQLGSQNAGISATISASPEYGFGSLIARMERRQRFVREVQEAVKSNKFATDVPKDWLSKWAINAANSTKSNQLAPDVIARLLVDGSSLSKDLLASKQFFFTESQWLIGSDAWAYDLGNSGVHHVLASGANVNMLIIDSQPYSERDAADPTRRKKDIGLYAMNYGNAYVASVAAYSSYTQVLQAIAEADQFNGPSVIVAYLPYSKEDDSPLTVLQETKKAVDLGYWPLYRWNPNNAEKGEPNFALDSERIKRELEEFLRRDNQLTQIMNRNPRFSAALSESYGSEVRTLQKRAAKDAYDKLLEGLFGAPLTILFGSDNGNAENLAKRLGNRGKARGLKTLVMAMDDYPVEDLATEENIVIITSTAGQGEFPQNGRNFWETVKNSADLDLSSIRYSVFSLGDSHYWPRKEDRIYYNKPGKDLDSRISFLGGKLLTEIGLGDDQDPDGYQTGYQEWEPRLWQALGVDKVEGLPEEPPPLTNEDIKIQSNYLRGTIAEGLKDTSTGAISASDQQLTKFHGTYMQDDRDIRDERKAQGLEPAYSFMIRCRLPGGVATPSQWLQMDAISSAYGNETMKLTTRQTFQFHGVVKGKLRAAMQAINRSLMSTIAACGDVNRNVMCSSLPELSAYHREVHEISKRISDHLLPATTAYHEIWLKDENDKKVQIAGDAVVDHEPLYGPTYLPRKFKITIAIPPHNDTDVYAHDIGLIAIKGADGHLEGFNILAGGGMGVTHNNKKTYPRTGSMFGYVPASEAHIVCEKIMLVQRDHGDRKNRKHARLKYTIDDMGVDVFKGKVEELLPGGLRFETPRPFKFDSNVDTFGWQKDEYNLNHFTFFIENGRIEDTADFQMRTGLRELSKLEKGEFRLTGNQHLILSNIKDEDLPAIKQLMAAYKLDNTSFTGLRLSSSACVAFPTCGLAMAESERYLPILISKLESTLEENGLARESIVMRMTGCPNGCARPWLAEVAFVGKAYGAYNMYLGGGYHGQRLNKLYRASIKEEEILDIMKGLLKRYALERNADGGRAERFGDWCIRAGIINETTEGRRFHEGTLLPTGYLCGCFGRISAAGYEVKSETFALGSFDLIDKELKIVSSKGSLKRPPVLFVWFLVNYILAETETLDMIMFSRALMTWTQDHIPTDNDSTSDDPVIASYDIFITDAQVRRFLLQYPDRSLAQPYSDLTLQKPTEFRLKPKTGLVEVDIPINTRINYDESKGLRYGNALKKSRVLQEGGTHGLAGGFNTGGVAAGRAKLESDSVGKDYWNDGNGGEYEDLEDEAIKAGHIMTTQTLGGRIQETMDGDPIYMLGAFKENELHLAPLSAIVQVRPQLHHLDAFDEVAIKSKASAKGKKDLEDEGGPRSAPEARAIDVKVKSAEAEQTGGQRNNELLKRMQDEKWEKYTWIDENDEESWDKYEEYMFNRTIEEPPQLESAIEPDDYIDGMSAPRVDPTRPDMTGWAMRARRKKRGLPEKAQADDDIVMETA